MNSTSPQSSELEGRVALITGAARNIGRAIVETLATAGAGVVINARSSQAEAEALAADIRSKGGEALAVVADITDEQAVRAMLGTAVGRFGRLDILVNNAAARADTPLEEIGWDEWRSVVGSILDGAFLCSQAAIGALKKSGGGAIINITGVAAHVGLPHRAHVAAAKAGLAGLSRALAAEFAQSGVTVNCVSPGYIQTQRKGNVPPHFLQRPAPIGRSGAAAEVAAMVRYLAGPHGRFITGQTMHLNGGWFMG